VEIRDFLQALRKYWWVVVSITLALGGLAALVSFRATPSYTARSSVFVSIPTGNTAGELNQGSAYAQNLMESFADLATRPLVLERVISDLRLTETPTSLARRIDAQVAGDTVILEISADSTDPEGAAELANAVVRRLGDAAGAVSPKSADGKATVEMTALGRAIPPREPSSPNTRRNLAVGLMAGVLLGAAVAAVLAKLDTRVRKPQDVSRQTAAPILAELGAHADMERGVIAMRDKPLGPTAEEFRRLRANLEFLRVGGQPIAMVVTSAGAGEGKTSTTINLAIACAQNGDRVLLIDADLRKPTVAERLGLEQSVGLSTLLTQRISFEESVVHQVRALGIDVLTSGRIPPNPADLLSSSAMTDLLTSVLTSYDVVLVDTPPVLPVVDAAVLTRQVAGAVLVVRAHHTRKEAVGKAVESLSQVGGRLLGVILNSVERSRSAESYQHYRINPKQQNESPRAVVPTTRGK
jgi:capsular exopolysaccharide synthesis family protein